MTKGVPENLSSSISRHLFQISLKIVYERLQFMILLILGHCLHDCDSTSLDFFLRFDVSSCQFSFEKSHQFFFHSGVKRVSPVLSTIHSHTHSPFCVTEKPKGKGLTLYFDY